MVQMEKDAELKAFSCDECSKSFTKGCNLTRHKKDQHAIKSNIYVCPVPKCGKQFFVRRYLQGHIRLHHEDIADPTKLLAGCEGSNGINEGEEEEQDGKFTCPNKECCRKYGYLSQLRTHIHSDHEPGVSTKEEHRFSSLQEFYDWKEAMEKKSQSAYVAQRGVQARKDGYTQIFYCNRSGTSTEVPEEERKRVRRSQGSRKIGYYCTSAIYISVAMDGQTNVDFYSKHYGHGRDRKDLVHMPLPKSDREWIADKILKGDSFREILHEIRRGNSNDRMALVQLKDLHNIKAACSREEALRHDSSLWMADLFDRIEEDDPLECIEQCDDDDDAGNSLAELKAELITRLSGLVTMVPRLKSTESAKQVKLHLDIVADLCAADKDMMLDQVGESAPQLHSLSEECVETIQQPVLLSDGQRKRPPDTAMSLGKPSKAAKMTRVSSSEEKGSVASTNLCIIRQRNKSRCSE